MFKKTLSIILTLTLCVLIFTSCSSKANDNQQKTNTDDKLNVVCTIYPQYDFIREIAEDKVNLTMLLSPENESHSYEASLSDISTIKNADLFIYVGGETDTWVKDIIKGCEETLTSVAMTSLVNTLDESDVGILTTEEEEEEEEEDDAFDEHVWTSLKNAQIIVNNLATTLSSLDSNNEAFYKENANNYCQKLSELDKEYNAMVSSAKTKTIVIADRNPFRYLFDDYGINAVAAFSGCTSNTEIKLDVLRKLVKAVKDNNLDTVFVIEFNKSTYADSICEETGATKKTLNSCHNVTQADFDNGKTYYQMMKENLEVLKEAMN